MREYSAVLLPHWVQFDLTQPVAGPLDEAIALMLGDVPRESAKRVRAHLRERLSGLLTQLASAGVTAVFMPAENPSVASAFPVLSVRPADFVVDGEPMDPMDYLIALVGSGAASIIEPEGMVGVRRVTDRDSTAALREALADVPADMADGLDVEASAKAVQHGRLSREVEYIIGVPQSEDRWMSVTGSLSVIQGEASEELLGAVTQLADRWVETIRWVEESHD